jgi:hypothetical protein
MFGVLEVKALPKYKIWVRFADAEGEVDLSYLTDKGVFSRWKDYSFFKKVHVGSSGEIAWDDEIDICPDSIYMKLTGKTPEELFPNLSKENVNT